MGGWRNMNWIEVTHYELGHKVLVNLDEVRAMSQGNEACDIHYKQEGKILTTKETYNEVLEVLQRMIIYKGINGKGV